MLENLTISQVIAPEDYLDLEKILSLDGDFLFLLELRDEVILPARSNLLVLLARDRSDPVGYGVAQKDDPILFINNMFVREDRRDRGIGKALAQGQIDYAKAYGFKEIRTTTDSGNIASLQLQRSMGFRLRKRFFMGGYESKLRLR